MKSIYEDLLREYIEDPSPYNRSELSDFGINTFREEARKMGYDRRDMEDILKEEAKRARGLAADKDGLWKYLRSSRAGSMFRLNRKAKAGLFLQLASKGFLRPGRVASESPNVSDTRNPNMGTPLRKKLILLAHEKPELRKHLVPLLRVAEDESEDIEKEAAGDEIDAGRAFTHPKGPARSEQRKYGPPYTSVKWKGDKKVQNKGDKCWYKLKPSERTEGDRCYTMPGIGDSGADGSGQRQKYNEKWRKKQVDMK